MHGARRVAVVGGGWAGLAAAVQCARQGQHVHLYEMAAQLGGRARSVQVGARLLDNGQHLLIGAYTDTLSLLADLGVSQDAAFLRTPLALCDAGGRGLRLRAGRPAPAFAGAVLRLAHWPWRTRLALLAGAAGWAMRGFRCDPALTVDALTAGWPHAVRDELIEPLCAAALNTPASQASATVFLRVLHDALLSGAGCADLMLPRQGLSRLLPDAARAHLARAGAVVSLQHRVGTLSAHGTDWRLDDALYDQVILAASPAEAARLVEPIEPTWSACARALRFEPIVTVYLHSAGARLSAPMLALRSGPQAPAQFVFDRGQLGDEPGLLAFVVSAAQPWVDRGAPATAQATLAQAHAALGPHLGDTPQVVHTLTEKRATFACTPGLNRPAARIAPGLYCAGDFVAGPYPATLEGAVRSGLGAAALVAADTPGN